MAYLFLIRHGQTEWNALGLFSGQTDIELTEEGVKQAQQAADLLKNYKIDLAHTSELKRAKDTLQHLMDGLGAQVPTTVHSNLNERSYGRLEGKSKAESKAMLGEEAVHKVRRAWDFPVEDGETLKDVHGRVTKYYEEHVLSDLQQGKNIIISSHNNTLRALVKYLENISDEDIETVELGNAEILAYKVEPDGTVSEKLVLKP
jgi:2,3-bisphosphoglycerate-dependent phosphoglycerate mutase